MQFVVLGNPANRRCTLFCAAVEAAGLPPPRVVSWAEHLRGGDALERALSPGAVLRIESPGEDAEVERLLLLRGVDAEDPEGLGTQLSARTLAELRDTRGRIRAPRQWYLGFSRALAELGERIGERRVLTPPATIVELFDKARSQRRLEEAGVPVPEILPASPRSFAGLRAALETASWGRVFVKLRYGSSASGVVALAVHGERCVATTSAELVRGESGVELYNSLRVRRYTDPADVGAVLDALCAEGVHVERWVPKASLGGPFDLRVLAVGGVPRHAVVRVGRTTLTNLHLGNARGDLGRLQARLGEAGWERLRETVAAAAGVYADALHLGVDVAVAQGFKRCFVLELNAFGDLLPGLEVDGRDTYAAEVAAALERF